MAISGSCLCGTVRYVIAGAPSEVYFCHCTQCQKAQGSAFAASVPVPVTDFSLVSGVDALRAYRSSPAKSRFFCSNCGSPVYSQVDGNAMLRVRAGTIDPPHRLAGVAHIFASRKATWYDPQKDLPQYDEREPGRKPA